MKALLYIPQLQAEWIWDYFPGISPFMLKICNKPLLEYYIDFCSLLGIKQIRILINDPGRQVEKYFSDGGKWGVELSYSLSKANDEPDLVILKNRGFIGTDKVLMFYGFGFLNYDKEKSYDHLTTIGSFLLEEDDFKVLITSSEAVMPVGNLQNPEGLSQTGLKSIKEFWQLNISLLQGKAGNYVLPGYNNEPGVYLGKNFSYPVSASLQKPLLIGDRVALKNSVLLGPEVVLGDDVIIDSRTSVKHSIIYEATYIGSDLEIDNRIVNGNRLIDPESGEYINLIDEFFMSSYKPGLHRSFLNRFINTLFALLLSIVYFVPYYLLGFLSLPGGIRFHKVKSLLNKRGKESNLILFWKRGRNPFGILFLKFSLDKYPLYCHAFLGRIWLIGNQILPADAAGRRLLHDIPDYCPAVMSYSELLGTDHRDLEFINHEMYYMNHSSLKMDLGILFSFLWKRFWH